MNGIINVKDFEDRIRVNNSVYVTRNRPTLIQDDHSTCYGMNEPMNRLIRMYNMFKDDFIASNSINVLKAKISARLSI